MNPEDRVIDEIDALVDETMTAGVDVYGNPLDDHRADRYPKCPQCHHDWHGIRCWCCSCRASDGEVEPMVYVDQVTSVCWRNYGAQPIWRADENQDGASIVRVPEHECVFDRTGRCVYAHNAGYTIADIEAMRRQLWR